MHWESSIDNMQRDPQRNQWLRRKMDGRTKVWKDEHDEANRRF
jgi:hypothetical protein